MTSSHRLVRKDFSALPRNARRLTTPYFTVSLYSSTAPQLPKYTVVVSKKVSNKAVDRNTVKRRIRAILTTSVLQLPKGTSLVVSARPASLGATTTLLQLELLKILGS